jgi:threonine synthase
MRSGADEIAPVRPTGIAKSLNIGDPAAGLFALDAVRRTGGWMDDVSDDEIRDGIGLLARTVGIFAETAGGVTVAVLRKLIDGGRLDPGAETVVLNTGEGLKTIDAVAVRAVATHRIRPTLRAVRDAGLLG